MDPVAESSSPALLQVHDLHTDITTRQGVARSVGGVSLRVEAGETVGLVGESGSGKTMTAMSLVRLLPRGAQITSGSILLQGRDLVPLSDKEIRSVRGNEIGVVFQDPMTSLNPTMTIGQQIGESVRTHHGASRSQARTRALDVLGLVGMPRPAERLDEYPHQLSGGMRQRAMIAVALACEPKLLIADEPTTALDVTIQAQILELLDDLRQRLGMGMLLVTHDMGVIAGHADRVMVMYAGKIAESGPTETVFADPNHRYTEALLKAVPSLDQDRTQRLSSIPGTPPDLTLPVPGCSFAARCGFVSDRCRSEEPHLDGLTVAHQYACHHPRQSTTTTGEERTGGRSGSADRAEQTGGERPALLTITNVSRRYPVGGGVLRRGTETLKAVSEVSLSVRHGETFGLVGESGCGKSTLSRLIVGLEQPDEGSVLIDGTAFDSLSRQERRARRRDVQLVFQDSYSSMNPKMRIGAIMRDPLRVQKVGSAAEQRARVSQLIDSVGLPRSVLERFPYELSGGQRQRVGFARALTLSPKLIVADEPVSALDVSVQAQIINLMGQLQSEFDLTYVVVSHDLSVVRYVADRIGVMYLGRIVEIGPSDAVYSSPAHPYTAGLLESIPVPTPQPRRSRGGSSIRGELPSAIDPPPGCPFHTRCPHVQERCTIEVPRLQLLGADHSAACHFPLVPPQEGGGDAGSLAGLAH